MYSKIDEFSFLNGASKMAQSNICAKEKIDKNSTIYRLFGLLKRIYHHKHNIYRLKAFALDDGY